MILCSEFEILNVARSYLSILSNLNAASKNVPPSYQAREYLGNIILGIRNLDERLVGIGDWVWITRNLKALYLKVKSGFKRAFIENIHVNSPKKNFRVDVRCDK